MTAVRYRIDAQDRISELGEGWLPGLADPAAGLLGRDLWSVMEDATTIELYRRLVAIARETRAVRVPYRCDAPWQRRWFELAITPAGGGAVEFLSTLVRTEDRPPVALLEPDAPRDERLLRMCSWCQRIVLADGQWATVEKAVRELRLLEQPSLPRITHGICPECAEQVWRRIRAPL